MFNPEKGKQQSESEKRLESKEAFDDIFIKTIINEADRTDAGQKGVVFKLQSATLPDDIREVVGRDEVSDQAAKMIKVYSEGVGKREFSVQKQAHKIVKNTKHGKECAQIPEPNLYQDVTLKEDQREKISKRAEYNHIENKAEFIVMDFVDGKKLYTHLLNKILSVESERNGNSQVSDLPPESLQPPLSDEAIQRAQNIANFKKIDKDKAVNNLEYDAAHQVHKQNVKNLFEYLKHKGVEVKETVISQLENAIDLLHENGIAHRDLHWENIMIEGSPFQGDKGPAKVYIIDFGESVVVEGADNVNEAFEEEGRQYVEDDAVPSQLNDYLRRDSQKQSSGVSSPFTRIDTRND